MAWKTRIAAMKGYKHEQKLIKESDIEHKVAYPWVFGGIGYDKNLKEYYIKWKLRKVV
jgi:hypothetical protein